MGAGSPRPLPAPVPGSPLTLRGKPGPSPGRVPVGLSTTGRILSFRPGSGPVLLSGATGSGKSTLALFIMLYLASLGWSPVIVNPLVIGYEPLETLAAGAFFTEPVEALAVLVKTADEAVRRYRTMREEGRSRYSEGRDGPRVALLLEEIPMLTSTCPDAKTKSAILSAMTRVANIGRKAGIQTVLVTQQPSAEAIGTACRGACSVKIGMRNDPVAWEALGSEADLEVRSQTIQRPGDFLLMEPEFPGWQQARSWDLQTEESFEIAGRIKTAETIPCHIPHYLDPSASPETPEIL